VRQIPPRCAGACNTFKEPAKGMWGILNKDQNEELKIDIANNLLKDKKECDFMQGTKNCATKLMETLCTVLSVANPYLQLIL
jgi:hypothetical protein